VAKVHANVWSKLKKEGILIGPYDLIIAATCFYRQQSLLTFNSKEFSRVPNLKLASLD
jgi:tRNA(fMet)-specific endonuclease VapC